MRKIREILRLRWEVGLSHRDIIASCGIGHGTVVDYLRRAQEAGLTWPLPAGLSDRELETQLFPPAAVQSGARDLPHWPTIDRELRKKGVTLQLLWEEYRSSQAKPLGYSWFCELYQRWHGAADPRMRQVHKAGEKLFVDYAGMTMPVFDRGTGERREAQIFVAALGASSYIYTEATWTQTLPDWISSHVRAFAHLGGVPELVVPDNLKSGVQDANYYEPDLNPTYLALAQHYGTVILPARVRKPRDKSKVENSVLQVERRCLAPLRNQQFFRLTELNHALQEQAVVLNDRITQGLPASRRELFETIDRPALKPLPTRPYELALWLKARVHPDYHIDVERHYYSVPYELVREQVDVRLTAAAVEIFYQGERVASHVRSSRRYGFTTAPEHMPPGHRAYAERDPARVLERARQIGPETEELCRRIMASRPHPEQGLRSCMGVLKLAKIHGAARLECACRRGVRTGATAYRSLKAILHHRLEDAPLPAEVTASAACPAPREHANVRGADYYRP